MPRPQDENKQTTSIGMIPKHIVTQIRMYARKSDKRKGYESTAEVLKRIMNDYTRMYPPQETPKDAYDP